MRMFINKMQQDVFFNNIRPVRQYLPIEVRGIVTTSEQKPDPILLTLPALPREVTGKYDGECS